MRQGKVSGLEVSNTVITFRRRLERVLETHLLWDVMFSNTHLAPPSFAMLQVSGFRAMRLSLVFHDFSFCTPRDCSETPDFHFLSTSWPLFFSLDVFPYLSVILEAAFKRTVGWVITIKQNKMQPFSLLLALTWFLLGGACSPAQLPSAACDLRSSLRVFPQLWKSKGSCYQAFL